MPRGNGGAACSSFSKTMRSGMRERRQIKGWSTSLSGNKAENCSQIGSMKYERIAGMGTHSFVGKLQTLSGRSRSCTRPVNRAPPIAATSKP